MLHKVIGKNRYCGPAAISAIFNIPTHQASKMVREVTGNPYVKGIYNSELIKALTNNGIEVVKFETPLRPTLSKAVSLLEPGAYIVNVTRHYLAVDTQSWQWADNKYKKPRSLDDLAKPRSRVHYVIKIESGTIAREVPPPPKPKPTCWQDLFDNYASDALKQAVQDDAEWFEDYELSKQQFESTVQIADLQAEQSVKTIRLMAGKYGF